MEVAHRFGHPYNAIQTLQLRLLFVSDIALYFEVVAHEAIVLVCKSRRLQKDLHYFLV
jgi:hypothetical protein